MVRRSTRNYTSTMPARGRIRRFHCLWSRPLPRAYVVPSFDFILELKISFVVLANLGDDSKFFLVVIGYSHFHYRRKMASNETESVFMKLEIQSPSIKEMYSWPRSRILFFCSYRDIETAQGFGLWQWVFVMMVIRSRRRANRMATRVLVRRKCERTAA